MPPTPEPTRNPLAVFLVFLRLGCTSFGGPIAHLGYFQSEFVQRRRWLTPAAFAELVALAQSLPGPSSSQVGYAIGITRAGLPGGIAAWLGFTLPSAALMLLFAFGHALASNAPGTALANQLAAILHGLQLVAVAVVAQAVFSMQRSLAPDRPRILFAVLAAAIVLFAPATFATPLVIAFAALAGLRLAPRNPSSGPTPDDTHDTPAALSPTTGMTAAILFSILLLATLLPSHLPATLFASLYRTGSLVFGGGHVVLPLLEDSIVARGWIAQPAFLAGYGAAQALPGPLFSFAAFLGATAPTSHPLASGVLALAAIFLPGILLITAILPFWHLLRRHTAVQSALWGINAAVVGILIAALYQPVWTSTIHTPRDFFIALAAFAALTAARTPPWLVVLAAAFTAGLATLY